MMASIDEGFRALSFSWQVMTAGTGGTTGGAAGAGIAGVTAASWRKRCRDSSKDEAFQESECRDANI